MAAIGKDLVFFFPSLFLSEGAYDRDSHLYLDSVYHIATPWVDICFIFLSAKHLHMGGWRKATDTGTWARAGSDLFFNMA